MDYTFDFDPRLAWSATPPSSWYVEPDLLRLEKQKVFSQCWQLVGRLEQVTEVGQYFTAVIGDEPVIVARGADHKLRAFSNVCRHRAGPVATGAGCRKSFQCGYHGWSYGLDGHLAGTPEFEGVECFEKGDHGLPQFAVDVWNSLVFVNIDPASMPLEVFLGGIPEKLKARDLSSMRFAERKDWYVDCNWKVYVDNYLEGYHIPIVHPSLNREIDYSKYRTETDRYYSIQHSPLKKATASRIRMSGDSSSDEAQFFWIFPNLMLNVYPDNYSTNLIIPVGPERTLTVFEWYFMDPEKPDVQAKLQETIEFSDEIQLEDIRICEAVQRGLRSSTYDKGRYSVKRENGVHHFHGLLSEFLSKDGRG
jgi:choline monooxygenase